MTEWSAQFIAIAEEAREFAARNGDLDDAPLAALEAAAEQVGKSWSKSNLGYQANVYYRNFQVPPSGAMFSREWGFLGRFQGTTGDWHPYQPEPVVAHIEQLAGNPNLSGPREQSDVLRPQVEQLIQRARSLAAKVPPPHDDYLRENIEELQRVSVPDVGALARAQMHTTSGQFVVRDAQALEGGWQPAGHQVALANVMHIRSPYAAAEWLATVCDRLVCRVVNSLDKSYTGVCRELDVPRRR